MKLSAPLTKETLRNHFRYNWWKHVLIVILSFFLWDMFYIQTAYHPPENKRIDIYVQSAITDPEALDAYLYPLWQESVPDMELVSSTVLIPGGAQDYYSNIQLTTYIVTGQGDIYMLPASEFKRFAAQGSFVALEDYKDSGQIAAQNLDWDRGYVTYIETDYDEKIVSSELHLYGIPCDSLTGFQEAGVPTDNMVLSVAVNSGNEENCIRFLNALIQYTERQVP